VVCPAIRSSDARLCTLLLALSAAVSFAPGPRRLAVICPYVAVFTSFDSIVPEAMSSRSGWAFDHGNKTVRDLLPIGYSF
jgi:hypothetical protein